jgi:predicted Zn-dependent peptidase
MVVRIVPCEGAAPADKVADAELIFEDGVLAGMKLVGFAIWRNRRQAVYSVTFPTRQYLANGERRSYVLLRPVTVGGSQEALRLLILQAYAEYERQAPLMDAGALVEAPVVETAHAETTHLETAHVDTTRKDTAREAARMKVLSVKATDEEEAAGPASADDG